MALETRSKFYFGHEIDTAGIYLDFDEGGPILTAEVVPGYYSATEFVAEVQRALNSEGALTYTVSFDRSTRIITISASGTFAIRGTTGTHAGNSLYDLLGYTGADLTGANTYTFTEVSGLEYKPQFFLLDWVDQDQRQEATDTSITTTGSGRVEVVRFDVVKFIEFTIDFINNYARADESSQIETNLNGKGAAVEFLQSITKKGHIELMPDRDDPDTFVTLLLESTSNSRNGTGYRLAEKTGQGLVGFYTTGLLTWRVVD